MLFQSTRPVRGATAGVLQVPHIELISIHAPRAGRDLVTHPDGLVALISIHAPRAGRDDKLLVDLFHESISIHAPRAGRDLLVSAGARRYLGNFNPRAPCGARPQESRRQSRPE